VLLRALQLGPGEGRGQPFVQLLLILYTCLNCSLPFLPVFQISKTHPSCENARCRPDVWTWLNLGFSCSPGSVRRWWRWRRRTRSGALSSSTAKEAPPAKKLSENLPNQSRTSSRQLTGTAEDRAWTGFRAAATRATFSPATIPCLSAILPSKAIHIKRVSNKTQRSWRGHSGETYFGVVLVKHSTGKHES